MFLRIRVVNIIFLQLVVIISYLRFSPIRIVIQSYVRRDGIKIHNLFSLMLCWLLFGWYWFCHWHETLCCCNNLIKILSISKYVFKRNCFPKNAAKFFLWFYSLLCIEFVLFYIPFNTYVHMSVHLANLTPTTVGLKSVLTKVLLKKKEKKYRN